MVNTKEMRHSNNNRAHELIETLAAYTGSSDVCTRWVPKLGGQVNKSYTPNPEAIAS